MFDRHARWTLALVLLLGLCIRLPFLAADWRVSSDLASQRAWILNIQSGGVVALYDGTAQLYPPLMTFLYALIGSIVPSLQTTSGANEQPLNVLIKLTAVLADVFTAWLLGSAFRVRPRLAIVVAAVYLVHPAIWYVSVFWGQMDSVYTALMLLGLVTLERKQFARAGIASAAAIGVKLQALAVLPILLPAALRRGRVRALAVCVCVIAFVFAALTAPWWLSERLDDAFWDSIALESRTPRVVVSGYNLWYLVVGEGAPTSNALDEPMPGVNFRLLGFVLYGVYAAFIAWRVWRDGSADLPLAAALATFALFLVATQVHERYLYPVIALLLLAAASGAMTAPHARRTRVLVILFLVVSCTFSFNLITVAQPYFVTPINLVAAPPGTFRIDLLKGMARAAAVLNVLVFALLTFLFWRGKPTADAPA